MRGSNWSIRRAQTTVLPWSWRWKNCSLIKLRVSCERLKPRSARPHQVVLKKLCSTFSADSVLGYYTWAHCFSRPESFIAWHGFQCAATKAIKWQRCFMKSLLSFWHKGNLCATSYTHDMSDDIQEMRELLWSRSLGLRLETIRQPAPWLTQPIHHASCGSSTQNPTVTAAKQQAVLV
jgi:hypothetical protein